MLRLGSKSFVSPVTREGERIYAVGDVHGCFDLLARILGRIVRHCENLEFQPREMSILFLGDVIDRGKDSAKCLGAVRKLIDTGGAKMILGNHEEMLLSSLDGNPQAQKAWLENGGLATLESYGIAPPRDDEDAYDFAERLQEGIPQEDQDLLRSLPVHYRSGDYYFVHAGVRPGVPLDRQDRSDLYSIRREFAESEEWHGAMIVHGHGIVDHPELRRNRIACDTGAYRTGRLSCVCLQDSYVSILTT